MPARQGHAIMGVGAGAGATLVFAAGVGAGAAFTGAEARGAAAIGAGVGTGVATMLVGLLATCRTRPAGTACTPSNFKALTGVRNGVGTCSS